MLQGGPKGHDDCFENATPTLPPLEGEGKRVFPLPCVGSDTAPPSHLQAPPAHPSEHA